MSEFSCLHENERYAACDDESYTVTSRTFVCQMSLAAIILMADSLGDTP